MNKSEFAEELKDELNISYKTATKLIDVFWTTLFRQLKIHRMIMFPGILRMRLVRKAGRRVYHIHKKKKIVHKEHDRLFIKPSARLKEFFRQNIDEKVDVGE